MEYRKCFVPSCKNDTNNSPNKLFVRVREELREKWCQEVKAEYFKVYTMFCCEDHLDPTEDFTNYYQCKLMHQEPKLKRLATLRNIAQDTREDISELTKLMLQQPSTSKSLKRKYEDIRRPSTSSCSTLPTKVNAATQCKIEMLDKGTNYKVRKTPTNIATVEVQSSQEISSGTTPSLFGGTSETDESIVCDSSKIVLKNRNNMLDMVLKNLTCI